MKKGLLIVVSGPSGVGKSTVREEYSKDKSLNLVYSISFTTREKRIGEQDGVDYFFVSPERFQEAIENDELLEYASFVGNSYGTPKAYVEKLRNEGKNVILEIDINGAKQVMSQTNDVVSIFITPPSFEELKNRIIARGADSFEIINQRLAKAESEMKESVNYKYVICNREIKQTALEIADIIKKEMNKQ